MNSFLFFSLKKSPRIHLTWKRYQELLQMMETEVFIYRISLQLANSFWLLPLMQFKSKKIYSIWNYELSFILKIHVYLFIDFHWLSLVRHKAWEILTIVKWLSTQQKRNCKIEDVICACFALGKGLNSLLPPCFPIKVF